MCQKDLFGILCWNRPFRMMSICVVVVLVCAIVFGLVASLCMIIAVSTNYWEISTFQQSKIEAVSTLDKNNSTMYEQNQLYVVSYTVTHDNGTTGKETAYLRSTYGGIWQLCDYITDKDRNTLISSFKDDVNYLKYSCFRYILDYKSRKDDLDDKNNGTWLVRVQTSAASSNIVCLLSLFTAALTGVFGLFHRQVSACMVTGVMYFVAGIFNCFSLIYIHTKVNYMTDDCYSLDPIPEDFCKTRNITTGWSLHVAWVSFVFVFIACGFWLYLARCLRLEKAKCML